MKIEVVAIGDEILSGHTVNTNAAFISEKLNEKGYSVSGHSVIQDEEASMEKALKEALLRSDIVIVTGGLGPTLDDKTKKVLSRLFKTPLAYQKEIALDLSRRYKKLSSLIEQATIPKKALFFKNTLGTAPGLVLSLSDKIMICLPGVPQEMKEMFLLQALPFIEKKLLLKEKIFEKRLFLSILQEVDVDPTLREIQKACPKVKIGIYPAYALLQVCFSLKAGNQKEADKILNPMMAKLKKRFSSYVYSETAFDIALALHELLIKKDLKIAFAESCTGGALCASMTKIPGSSNYFLGGIVSYSNAMKQKCLQVSPNTLAKKGAVSQETVIEMTNGIFGATQADYAVAVSGIAGPTGGTKDKPLGTICIAVAKRGGKVDVGTIHSVGNREIVITYAVNYALSVLFRKISFNLTHFE